MSEIKVNDLIKEIKEGLKQRNASQKDEVRVMQAMLNDDSYKVDLYTKEGKVGEYCPAEDYKNMVGNIITSTTKISKEEAKALSQEHEASKSEAATMVNISKQFTLSYLETNRKLPLGGRSDSNFALSLKEVPEKVKSCPRKIGVDESGADIYETISRTTPAHVGLKAHGSCPVWLK